RRGGRGVRGAPAVAAEAEELRHAPRPRREEARDLERVGAAIGAEEPQDLRVEGARAGAVADRAEDRPGDAAALTDRRDRRRLHVDRDDAALCEAGERVALDDERVGGRERAARGDAAERGRAMLGSAREVDHALGDHELADADARADPPGDPEYDEVVDRG